MWIFSNSGTFYFSFYIFLLLFYNYGSFWRREYFSGFRMALDKDKAYFWREAMMQDKKNFHLCGWKIEQCNRLKIKILYTI